MTFAMVECSDGEWRPAIGGKRWIDDSLVWVFPDGKYRDRVESKSRPLVVIDPEDREQMARLVGVISETYSRAGLQFLNMGQMFHDERTGTLADALREFANPKPPKPAEPTGLGAVVEDSKGERWMRTSDENLPWYKNLSQGDDWRDWYDIDAVKVLSEGVPS